MLSKLPLLHDLVICREASSRDRRGGNDNGFTNKAEFVRRERGLGVVAMDVAGPGSLKSFWYSWPNHPLLPGFVDRAWGRAVGKAHFYFNGETEPRLSVPLSKWIGTPPFVSPLAIHGDESTGGYISYVPMNFEEGLRVTVDRGALPMFFYHAWYHCYPAGTPLPTWEGTEDLTRFAGAWDPAKAAVAPTPTNLLENVQLAPGASAEIFHSQTGGVIETLRMKLPEDDAALRSIWLKAWWDGEQAPSFEAPLSLLFAIENRFLKEPAPIVSNAPLRGTVLGQADDGAFYFRLPMPYGKNARLALENRGQAVATIEHIEIAHRDGEEKEEILSGLGKSAGYLRTQFRESRALTRGRDYLLAHLKGRGHIVGTVLAVADTDESFLEGDERIHTDGGRSPLVAGDATETYFNGSWYFGERAFSCPLHGAPTFRMKGKLAGSPSTITMYRFHLTDFAPYRSEARFTIQHGPFNDVEGHYRSLVFYYGLGEPSLTPTDALRLASPEDLEAHDWAGPRPERQRERSGFFEGEFNGQDLGLKPRPKALPAIAWVLWLTLRGNFHDPPADSPDLRRFTVLEHNTPYEFTVRIDPKNSGVLLRRLFDQSIPDQEALVEVDGEPAALWRNAGHNKWKIWAEDDLVLSPSCTQGKSQIRIRITPRSPLFTAAEYGVFSIVLEK